MTPNLTVVPFDPMASIRSRILAAQERAAKGDSEWIEGSIDLIQALGEGRRRFINDAEFGHWCKESKLLFGKDVRAALIGFSSDLSLARQVFTNSDSHSYDYMWRANKGGFRRSTKPPSNPNRKLERNVKRGRLHRGMKLGDDIMNKIEGTTLDTAPEMDALIKLKRTDSEIVNQLVSDAAEGKDVSAVATIAQLTREPPPPVNDLIDAFRKRLTHLWQRADHDVQTAFIDYLVDHMKGSHDNGK